MSAKEMFEELGYKIIRNKDNIVAYQIEVFYSFPNENLIIEFDSNKKVFKVFDTGIGVDVRTLQAINKQVEELRWGKK